MGNPRAYPFHPSLKRCFGTIETPLLALRLVRQIANDLDISYTETELILGLASCSSPAPFQDVCAFIPHVHTRQVRSIVKNLIDQKVVFATDERSSGGICYFVATTLSDQIKTIDKNMLSSR